MNRVLKAIVLSFILTGITWQAVAFNEADLQKLKSSLKCPKCDLADADLSGAKLAGANLNYANLDKARFFRAELVGANLTEADLTGVDLGFADLTGADLSGANLIDAYMEDTNLQDANLAGADLTLYQAVNVLQKVTHIEESEAHRMASLYPAECLNISELRGKLRPDQRADILHKNASGKVTGTWVSGKYQQTK